MRNVLGILAIGACAGDSAVHRRSATPPEVTSPVWTVAPARRDRCRAALYRPYAYNGVKIPFVFSCYLIKHGDDTALDTGHSMSAGMPSRPK